MRRRLGWIGPVAAATAITGVLACRQLVGITDNPPEDLTSTLCGLPYGTSACASCVNTNCCSVSKTCAADPACAAYEGCLGQCNGDLACRAQCTIDHPIGTSSAVSPLSACLASNCESACGLTCGAMSAYLTPPDASAPCETCFVANSACDPARACAKSVDCDAYTRCLVACGWAGDCREACASEHDAGGALFAPVWTAYSTTCAPECAYGNNWNCVGHVTAQVPDASSLTLALTAVDYDNMRVAGVAVRMAYEPPFDMPLSVGETDDSGTATLSTKPFPGMPPGSIGSPSPVPFQGWFQLSSPTLMPEWFGSTGGVSRGTYAFNLLVFTTQEFQNISTALGSTQDTSLAYLGLTTYDCLGAPAPNVKLEITGATTAPLTLKNVAGNSNGNTTGFTGEAYLYNVPVEAGALKLTATPAGFARPDAVMPYVFVQAGTATLLSVAPNQ